jgi:hypothetical protein
MEEGRRMSEKTKQKLYSICGIIDECERMDALYALIGDK